MTQTLICGAKRTAMGGLQGVFETVSAAELGGAAIRDALSEAGAAPDLVDECLMGCVLPAGQGQAPARQAGFLGGLGEHVPATTLNKMCGSGMKAVMMAHDQIAGGGARIMVAGGMESMSAAPFLLPKMRKGLRLGDGKVIDSMFLDGLTDAYDKDRLMGTFAEDCAEAFQFTRQAQDRYALTSLDRAQKAQRDGTFAAEITGVTVQSRSGAITVVEDEQPGAARPDKIPHLKPAFRDGGTVTAANSSSISDGAAALVLASQAEADRHALKIRAVIRGHASYAHAPNLFPTAPVPAARKLLQRIGWQVRDVDLWEVNEAFAVVPMAFMKEMGLSHDRVNVHGGACALGHPIGASGARILVTLLNALEKRNQKRGVAAICIGGGEGTAIAIERV